MRRFLAFLVLSLATSALVPPALATPQDSWTIDLRSSSLAFSATQVGAFVNGRFANWSGDIVLDPAALTAARIDIRIQTLSVTTDSRDVDSLLKGGNFLDVQKFPEARFVATTISALGGERYEARGRLTIRGVTRDTVLPFTLAIAPAPAQPGVLRGIARGRLTLKRLDYGVGQNEWAGTGQVADEVTIDVNIVASRAP